MCYITLGWKGLLGINTLAYWALPKLQRQFSVVNMIPAAYLLIVVLCLRGRLEPTRLTGTSH
jgi:hypothetical protein